MSTGRRPGKRKEPPSSSAPSRKRMKALDRRSIANQTSDGAFGDGELNVEKFVRAREYEIKALEEGIKSSKHGLSTRAFQEVPRDMRRRTASHNVKKIPKRLQIIEDNTPTGAARKRRLTPHQRLRLETAKRLQSLSAKSKKRRKDKREKKNADAMEVIITDASKEVKSVGEVKSMKSRKTRVKKSKLRAPDAPPAKFRKRQMYKTWLPTHLYHAKRATMTAPLEPLWRFALPLSPANKVYRITHRTSSMRGAMAWDASYMSTIGLRGEEKSIEGLLKALGVSCPGDRDGVWKSQGSKWRRGSRAWNGWLYERQGWPSKAIAPATVLWNPTPELNGPTGSDLPTKKVKRQTFIRVHPSAFLQLWEQVVRLGQIQKPSVTVEDLRFEIGGIEVIGPSAAEALVGVLRPLLGSVSESSTPTAESIWPMLNTVPDPSALPRNVVFSFEVADPRLCSPKKKDQQALDSHTFQSCLQLLMQWPLDEAPRPGSIFNRSVRLKAQRSLPSQQSVNRRKASAVPGSDPEPRETDPRIPVLIFTSRSNTHKQTMWTVLLPWKCVHNVWISLMRSPLSCGGQPRFGGLDQKRQLAFEAGQPWFPGDFPGTAAGNEWEARERAKRKKEWERKPKGRRLEYENISLGNGRKGELGIGWACDWDFLIQQQGEGVDEGSSTTKPIAETPLLHLPTSFASTILAQESLYFKQREHALITVRVTMLTRGVPKTCARIYQLPSKDPELRKKWLAQRPVLKSQKAQSSRAKPAIRHPGHDAPVEVYRAYLAASILNDEEMKPGSACYPVVPDKEDLIGFLTTGNYNLAEGLGSGIGSILLSKVVAAVADRSETRLCIIRDSGQSFGRLAKWELV